MKQMHGKRILAILLSLCLILTMIPTYFAVEAEAVSGVNSLTCAGFITNSIPQKYIDTMMRYYINNNSSLQTTLNNGLSVVFMFEGGSDNYWNGSTYYDGVGDVRNQAVCIVVKMDSSGNAYIAYYCENCSSIPDDPQNCTNGVAYSGATTVMDGIHSFYTWNHTGPYGAFQLNVGQGYYTPNANLNGYVAGASGLNIHTRSTNTCGGAAAGWDWSLGCQVIGSGYYTGNEFNQFMKVVAGINYNVWLDYYNKSFNTISTGTTKGYYVLDRQLGKMDINGTQFGSGSLIELYNSTALNNITAKSTSARNAAGFSLEYKDQCEQYASYCTLEVVEDDAELRGQPCSEGTDAGSTLIETVNTGDKLTAVGLYKNLYGNYWYEVKTSSGELGYVYAGNVKYIDDIISDVVLTDATYPVGHEDGATFYVNGTIKSTYNQLKSVACYIHSGFDASGEVVTGTSDTPSSNSYVLKGSTVDDATWMGALDQGNYTYAIYATYINYYATDPTTLESNSATLTLMEEIFAVIPTEVDPSTCSHTNVNYEIAASSCVQDGSSVVICSTCGLVTKVVTTGGHTYGAWQTTKAPACAATGLQERTCSACGDVQTQDISAVGHCYTSKTYPPTCLEYSRIEYICSVCSDAYSIYADELMTQWSEVKPEGVDESTVETKTQYRYSDYETVTSDSAALDGYVQINKEWIQSGSGTNAHVSEWPEGFLTTHDLYSQYGAGALSNTETETAKTVVGQETLVGYVYYHWCYGTYLYGPTNRTTSKTQNDTHNTFHAFMESVDTVDPTTLTVASDGSVTYSNASGCTDSWWWYYIPVYEQTYTNYTAQFTHERWTDYTDWSDTAVTASDTRKVETRTLYRYVDAELGDHNWVGGACSVCGTVCEHSYADRLCTICGESEPIKDFYLFGLINGANYGCESDYANTGEYKFVDDKLTVTFTQDSYVAVKSADNQIWYMTDGWQGYDVTSTVLYDALDVDNPDKMHVPGGVELIFTLTDNGDDTYTLSYEINEAEVPEPVLKPVYPSLALKDGVIMNVFYTIENLEGVTLEDMGLITFDSPVADGTVENAVDHIPGATIEGAYYKVHTNGISAKNLGDLIYFRVYAKLSDGSYLYSKMLSYSPKLYAQSQLNGADEDIKPLMVAMLEYGAAAQVFFQYKPDELMNADLTAEQCALIKEYHSDMVSGAVSVDSNKVGAFVDNGGFNRKYPRISLGGTFAINYYFTPANSVDAELTLYYWTQQAYDSASSLTAQNASGYFIMEPSGAAGEYSAAYTGIAAKNIDDVVYVAAVYESNGVSYCSGVLSYSIGQYCKSQAGDAASEQKDIAAATAVYGYYAKTYFASLP